MKNANALIPIFTFLFLVTITFACGSDEEGVPTPDTIAIQGQTSFNGAPNQTFQLVAVVKDANGAVLTNQPINWASDNTALATISNTGLLRLVASGTVSITASLGTLETSAALNLDVEPNLIAFDVASLSSDLAAAGGPSLTFLNESTMSAKLMEVATGTNVAASSPNGDQVYHFFDGSGTMNINGEEVSMAKGDVVFVAGGVSREITNADTKITIILTELKSATGATQAPFTKFTKAQTEAGRSGSANIWNPFLNERSVTFGLYMLPMSRGGDGRLVHTTDELNIIANGSSTFQTDGGTVTVQAGSVVFVRAGNGHFFRSLSSDIDILILWNK